MHEAIAYACSAAGMRCWGDPGLPDCQQPAVMHEAAADIAAQFTAVKFAMPVWVNRELRHLWARNDN